MDTFLIFNVNPALIISLYPADSISGRLHVSRDRWMSIFGAVEGTHLVPEVAVVADGSEGGPSGLLRSMAHLAVTKKASVDTLQTGKEEDTASVKSAEKNAPMIKGEERESSVSKLQAS